MCPLFISIQPSVTGPGAPFVGVSKALTTENREPTRGLATPGPFSFCPEDPGPHLENRIGMASQKTSRVVEARRLGHQRTQRLVNPWPRLWRCESSPAHHHHDDRHSVAPSPPAGAGIRLSSGRLAGSIPVGGANTPGSSNGRTRGSEPRGGGSSPSPGTKTTMSSPDLAKWEGGGPQNRHDRVRILTPRNLRFRGDPEEGWGPKAEVAQR